MIHYQKQQWTSYPSWRVYDDDRHLGVIERTPYGKFAAGPTSYTVDRSKSFPTRIEAAKALKETTRA